MSRRKSSRPEDGLTTFDIVTHEVRANDSTRHGRARVERVPGIDIPLIRRVSRAQSVVFPDGDANDFGGLGQLFIHALEDKAREVLTGGDEFSLAKLRHVEIDVSVIEPIPHLLLENPIEHAKIDDESGFLIDRSAHRHVANIAVSVEVGPRARAKRRLILRLAPLRPAIPMRSGEGDSSGEESGH